jgi:outer membrane protein, multidrug efflux system
MSDRTRHRPTRLAAAAALVLAVTLAGCATGLPTAGRETGAGAAATQAAVATARSQVPIPTGWQAPHQATAVPHGGNPQRLARWWIQLGDPLLVALIEDAQAASPNLSAARSRVEQARAARVAADASLLPRLDAQASVARGRQTLGGPVGWLAQAGPQASWEWDWMGGNRAASDAALARTEAASAQWHDARVSVAAETASTVLALRACEAQREQARLDAASREETSRLTALSERAGLQAPSNAALARASAAQGRAILTSQASACDSLVKALVALTARDEPALRLALAAGTAQLWSAQPSADALLAPLPADTLMQRPDLRAAALEWQAASADLRQADAARYPRISLAGSFSAQSVRTGGVSATGNTWSIGPVSITLPWFDGGLRDSQRASAAARLSDAEQQLRGRVRQAVREVEDALLQLASTAARSNDAAIAAAGFEASFKAAEARQRGGLASLFELEDARRSAVAANSALIDLQRDRHAAWIALYRAVGGDWPLESVATAAPRPDAPRTP